MAKASILYDVVNGIAFDAIIAPYRTAERDMAIQHLEKLRLHWTFEKLQSTLVIFDRGYPSAPFIIYLLKHGINFLMRCNTKFIKEVDEAVAKGEEDVIINFDCKRSGKAKAELKKLFPDLDEKEKVSIRVIVITLKTGEKEILLTSLLDEKQYPYEIFHELYFTRWGSEENYKFYKFGLEIENFSGKTCQAVEQDFYATVLAANVRALLAIEAKEEITNAEENASRIPRKYAYAINKNVSMEGLKNEFIMMLLDPKANIEQFCDRVKNIMKRNLVPIRPGRQFRRIRKHPKRKYHMNLR
jgi:hypothetical protein